MESRGGDKLDELSLNRDFTVIQKTFYVNNIRSIRSKTNHPG